MASRVTLANVLSKRAQEAQPSVALLPEVVTRAPFRGDTIERDDMRVFASTLTDRLRFAQTVFGQFGGARDFRKILGYKPTLIFEDYVDQYERGDIAKRIIDIPAEETWFAFPEVVDAEGRTGKFYKTWKYLARKLSLAEKFCRLDRAAGLGRFGLGLVGVNDGKDLNSPIGKVDGPEDITYVSVFAEGAVTFGAAITDVKSPSFGKPGAYQVDLARAAFSNLDQSSPFTDRTSSGSFRQTTGSLTLSANVHASRVIHLAEGRLESDLFGVPRLKPIFNRLFDLAKIVGGSAESYWLIANKGLHANIDPTKVRGYKPSDVDALSEQLDLYTNQLMRVIRTTGVEIKDLGGDGSGVNPRGVFSVVTAIIAGTCGIPIRMLFPENRGAQTSVYDRIAFREEFVLPRQQRVAEVQVIRPFVDMMIEIGGMPEPKPIDDIKGNYNVLWPDPISRSKADQAEIAGKIAEASANLAKARSLARIITPRQEQRILGFTEDGDEQDLLNLEELKKLEQEDAQKEADAAKAAAEAAAKARPPVQAADPKSPNSNDDTNAKSDTQVKAA